LGEEKKKEFWSQKRTEPKNVNVFQPSRAQRSMRPLVKRGRGGRENHK
jgi:hypothetical protein